MHEGEGKTSFLRGAEGFGVPNAKEPPLVRQGGPLVAVATELGFNAAITDLY